MSTGGSPTDERIRVLRIFSRLNVGGPSIHVVLLTEQLDPNRYDSTLVVGKEEEREGNFHELARQKNVTPVTLATLGRSVRPLDDLRSLWWLWRWMLREKPHVVHTHTAKAGALGRVAAFLAGVPVVVHTFHGSVFSGYFGNLTAAVYRWVERVLAHVTDAIIGVSPAVTDELVRHGLRPRHGAHTVSLGLELARFAAPDSPPTLRKELGLTAETPLIGCVGRFAPIKDLPTLLSACVEMQGVHFALIGDGSERAHLEGLADELGIRDRVHFMGFRSELQAIYPDFDVAVNCSKNEGTPVALIEAMAAGVPVAATRVGGSVDLLRHGELGALVEPGDAPALAAAIQDLLGHPSRRRDVAARARAYVLAKYHAGRLVRDIDHLYKDLLHTKGVSRSESAHPAVQA